MDGRGFPCGKSQCEGNASLLSEETLNAEDARGSLKSCPRFAPFFSALTWAQTIESPHHTWQAFSLTIGCPALQPNAFWNSVEFETTPLTRYCPGECGSVIARTREFSGVTFWHHI